MKSTVRMFPNNLNDYQLVGRQKKLSEDGEGLRGEGGTVTNGGNISTGQASQSFPTAIF